MLLGCSILSPVFCINVLAPPSTKLLRLSFRDTSGEPVMPPSYGVGEPRSELLELSELLEYEFVFRLLLVFMLVDGVVFALLAPAPSDNFSTPL